MGAWTRAKVVSTGLALAGRSDLTTLANDWLNASLRDAYASWPWPFLQRRRAGLSFPTGTQSLSVGAGSGGVTLAIQRVFDPFYFSTSDYSTRGTGRIRNLTGGSMDTDEAVFNPTTARGIPQLIKVRADETTWGKWTLIPYPVPDRDYLISCDYLEQPADLTSDSQVPQYPNDKTMVQMVLTSALQYMQRWKEW